MFIQHRVGSFNIIQKQILYCEYLSNKVDKILTKCQLVDLNRTAVAYTPVACKRNMNAYNTAWGQLCKINDIVSNSLKFQNGNITNTLLFFVEKKCEKPSLLVYKGH